MYSFRPFLNTLVEIKRYFLRISLTCHSNKIYYLYNIEINPESKYFDYHLKNQKIIISLNKYFLIYKIISDLNKYRIR